VIKATDEEQRMVENFIFLPLTKKVLDYDRKNIEESTLKFPKLYIELIEQASFKLSDQMRQTRKYIRDHDIKVIKKDDLQYEVVIRGYHENVGYHPTGAKEKVEQILREPMNL